MAASSSASVRGSENQIGSRTLGNIPADMEKVFIIFFWHPMFANGDQSSQFHSGLQEDDDASFDEFDFESSVPQPVSPSSNPLLGPPTGDTAETPETKNRPWNKQQRMAMTFVNSPKSLHDTVPPSSIQNSVPSESPTPPRSTTGDTTTSTTPPKSLDSSTSSGFRSLFRKPTKQEEEDRLKQEEERKQAEYNR